MNRFLKTVNRLLLLTTAGVLFVACSEERESYTVKKEAIARALINDPSIIMGEEPTGNLDSKNADNVFNIFKELSDEQHLSLLIVTHDEDFADRTDRIIRMEDGRIIT